MAVFKVADKEFVVKSWDLRMKNLGSDSPEACIVIPACFWRGSIEQSFKKLYGAALVLRETLLKE